MNSFVHCLLAAIFMSGLIIGGSFIVATIIAAVEGRLVWQLGRHNLKD